MMEFFFGWSIGLLGMLLLGVIGYRMLKQQTEVIETLQHRLKEKRRNK